MNNVTGIELERILFRGGLGQHNGRVERTQAACGSMRDKMNVGKTLRLASKIGWRCRLTAIEYFLLCRREMLFDALHLQCGFGQLGIILIGSDCIAKEKQVAGVFSCRSV